MFDPVRQRLGLDGGIDERLHFLHELDPLRRDRESLPVLQVGELLVELLQLTGHVTRQRRSGRQLLLDRTPQTGRTAGAAIVECHVRLTNEATDLAQRHSFGLLLLSSGFSFGIQHSGSFGGRRCVRLIFQLAEPLSFRGRIRRRQLARGCNGDLP